MPFALGSVLIWLSSEEWNLYELGGIMMKMIIGLEYLGPRHSGPLFMGGTSTVKLKLGQRQGARYADLSAQAARRLACVLLLQAEKVEMLGSHKFTKKLDNSINAAMDAVIRFHSAERKFQRRMRDRQFQISLKK